jgi:adenylylsulfate kinase-like enzyme
MTRWILSDFTGVSALYEAPETTDMAVAGVEASAVQIFDCVSLAPVERRETSR